MKIFSRFDLKQKTIFFTAGCLVFFLLPCCLGLQALSSPASGERLTMEVIAAEVEAQQVGLASYVLGRPLTPSQKELSRRHPLGKAVHGSRKFRDNDLVVVVDEGSDLVLGIYQEKKQVTPQHIQGVVGDLLLRFGRPSAMPDTKSMVWLYDRQGKITAERLGLRHTEDPSGEHLATVRLFSSVPFGENEPQDAQGSPLQYFFILSSDVLSAHFFARLQERAGL